MDVEEQYQVRNINKFAALKNLEDIGFINRTWENITEKSNFRPKRM
jgi:hypothetical protein